MSREEETPFLAGLDETVNNEKNEPLSNQRKKHLLTASLVTNAVLFGVCLVLSVTTFRLASSTCNSKNGNDVIQDPFCKYREFSSCLSS